MPPAPSEDGLRVTTGRRLPCSSCVRPLPGAQPGHLPPGFRPLRKVKRLHVYVESQIQSVGHRWCGWVDADRWAAPAQTPSARAGFWSCVHLALGLGHLSVLRHTCLVTVTRFLTMAPEGRAGLSACLKAVVSRAVWGPCPEGDPVMITVFLETGHATELTFPGSPEQSPGLGPPSCLEGPAPPQSWARSAHSRRSALHPGQVRRFGGEGPPRVARPAPPPDDEASNSDTLCCAFNCTSLCFSQGPFVVPQVGKLSYRP